MNVCECYFPSEKMSSQCHKTEIHVIDVRDGFLGGIFG